MSGCVTGNFHNHLRTFCPFYCTACNQWPLSNPANWPWSSLFRCKMGVKWLISSQSRQFRPPILNLSADPLAVRVICVTLWHVVNMRLLEKLQNNLFLCIFHQRNFYIDAIVWAVFRSWELALKYAKQTRRSRCLLGDKLLRQNIVVERPRLIKFPTLYCLLFCFFLQ